VAPDDPTASDAADVADAADAPAAAPPSDAEAVAAAPDAPPEAAPAPRATPDPPASDALPTEPYRVSVGAFASRENAETLAARFREADYPVFLAPQGELTLVLVGPYDDAARARATADEIRDGPYGIDPVVYEFRPDGGPAAAAPAADPEVGDPEVGDPEVGDAPATPDAAATPTPAAGPVEPAAEDAAPRADATASGTLLQLGAYADRDGAAPQIERLARLGFDVETIREDGLVKLLIGPLSSAELEDARVILDGAGVEYFAR
jgi:cell division septation protein DedD